jgi:hypothetical protein
LKTKIPFTQRISKVSIKRAFGRKFLGKIFYFTSFLGAEAEKNASKSFVQIK